MPTKLNQPLMRNLYHKVLAAVALLLLALPTFAQEASRPEMADGMRASGKIYVVVAVLVAVFVGIVVYLVLLDRKIGRLEKEIKE